jgi:DMSO/TMAO reductase YedYZ molybdopterin-dependent catalytic subunit
MYTTSDLQAAKCSQVQEAASAGLTTRKLYTTLSTMSYRPTSVFFFAMLFSLAGSCFAQSPAPAPAGQATQAPAELKIAIAGDVPNPITLTAADLAAMTRETAEITEQDGQRTSYEGVPLEEVLKKAGIAFGGKMRGKALAGYVLAEARDGYAVVFSLGEIDSGLSGEKILVADKRDGKPLFSYQGPARLVLPGDKEGARSVRMLEKFEVVQLRK